MPIRFTCLHCHRSLTVKDELAGKRGRCPYCKQVIVVPASRATAPVRDPKRPDLESLALSALGVTGGETVHSSETVVSGRQAEPIRVTCSWCDHGFEVAASLAGKQTPCPECSRIVRVPAAQSAGPRDWRQAARIPAGAASLQPQLQGEWGTVTTRSYVSKESLEQAAVLPVEREPLTPGQWAARIALGLLAVGLVHGGYRWFSAYRAESWKNFLMAATQLFLNNEKRSPEPSVAVQLALMQYCQLTEPDTDRTRSNVSRKARQYAAAAWQELQKLAPSDGRPADQVYQVWLAEYVARCCTAGMLLDDIRPGVEAMVKLWDRKSQVRQVIRRMAELAPDADSRKRALELFGRALVCAGSAAPAPGKAGPEEQKTQPPQPDNNRPEEVLLVVAQEFIVLGAEELGRLLAQAAQLESRDEGGQVEHKKPGKNEGIGDLAHEASGRQVGAPGVATSPGSTSPTRQTTLSRARPASGNAVFDSPLVELQRWAREQGKTQEAYQYWKQKWPDSLAKSQRWPSFQVLVEGVLPHASEELASELLQQCQVFAQAPDLRFEPEVQVVLIRLATAAGKDEVVKQLLQGTKDQWQRRRLLVAHLETALLRAKEYLPPENIIGWQELPDGERVYWLSRLAWHNARKDQGRCQQWANSLPEADRAVVAAILLAQGASATPR